MKIFIGPIMVGNYYALLAEALADAGEEVRLFRRVDNRFSGKQAEPIGLERLLLALRHRRKNTSRSAILRKVLFGILHRTVSLLVFIRFAFGFEVFIFSAGRSLLPRCLDLPILRMLGRKVFVVFNGSDVRPAYAGAGVAGDGPIDSGALVAKTRRQVAKLRRIERYATAIVNWPPMSMLTKKRFLNSHRVGVLNAVDEDKALTGQVSEGTDGSVRILHCPSKPTLKGTFRIREIIQRLSCKHRVEWVEVTDVANEEVIREIGKCDFVVDQLYSDTPMAGFATEAAWCAKPAVVGGYWAERVELDLPAEQIPPGLFVHPDRMEEAIEKLITDSAFRKKLGQEARDFVRTRWSKKKVAENWLCIFRGETPEDWWRDPVEDYCHGACVPEERTREVVREIVGRHGPEGLCLDHKPRLRDTFLAFAGIADEIP